MPFRFSLAVLLRLREGIERNQEIMLTTAHQAVRKLEQEIEEVHSTLKLSSVRSDNELTGSAIRARSFNFDCSANTLRRQCVQLQQRLVVAEKDRDIRAAAYREARRE